MQRAAVRALALHWKGVPRRALFAFPPCVCRSSMLGRLSHFLRARSRVRKLEHYAIPDALWAHTVATLPFVQRYGAADLAALRELATLFIAGKEYSTAHDLPLTDEMVTSVALQACVPILKLGI